MYVPKISTFDSIVKPLKKIKADLNLHLTSQNATIKSFRDKKTVIDNKIKLAQSEINKSSACVKKIDDLLGE